MNFLKRLFYWLLPSRPKIVRGADRPGFGAKKSKKDVRDLRHVAGSTDLLPESYSLRPWLSKVENQGKYNSCVGHAVTTAIETFAKSHGYPHYLELSRMHSWNMARVETWGENWDRNVGVFIRDAWKVGKKNGITIEKLFPYTPEYSHIQIHPSWVWKWYPAFSYYWINTRSLEDKETAIKEAIHTHKSPVVFGLKCPKSFQQANKTSEPWKPTEEESGGLAHAMIIVEYDKDSFTIMNSWGKYWGRGGFLKVDKQYFLSNAWDLTYCRE